MDICWSSCCCDVAWIRCRTFVSSRLCFGPNKKKNPPASPSVPAADGCFHVSSCYRPVDWYCSSEWVYWEDWRWDGRQLAVEVNSGRSSLKGSDRSAASGAPGADWDEIFLGTKYSNSSPQYQTPCFQGEEWNIYSTLSGASSTQSLTWT